MSSFDYHGYSNLVNNNSQQHAMHYTTVVAVTVVVIVVAVRAGYLQYDGYKGLRHGPEELLDDAGNIIHLGTVRHTLPTAFLYALLSHNTLRVRVNKESCRC